MRRHEQQQLAWLAWHTEALARTKKLPPLKEMMDDGRRRHEPQDPEILMANLKLAFGFDGEIEQ